MRVKNTNRIFTLMLIRDCHGLMDVFIVRQCDWPAERHNSFGDNYYHRQACCYADQKFLQRLIIKRIKPDLT